MLAWWWFVLSSIMYALPAHVFGPNIQSYFGPISSGPQFQGVRQLRNESFCMVVVDPKGNLLAKFERGFLRHALLKKVWISKNELVHLIAPLHIPVFLWRIVQWLRPLQHRVAISQFCLLILHETQLTSSSWFGLALLASRCPMQPI